MLLDGYVTDEKKSIRKLNFLIVMPRLVQVVGDAYQFPLGIAYISSALKAAGYNVYTLNLNHIEDVFGELEKVIKEHEIDAFMTGGISVQFNTLFELVKFTKKIKPNIINIMGGGLITADPEVAFDALEYVDFAVIGEGEITICDLAHALERGRDPSSVNGILYKQSEQFVKTPPRQVIKDIDTIPWPDYEGFELDKYLNLPCPDIINQGEERLAMILTSRSCPFSCTFCFHTVSKEFRKRSLDAVFEEVEYLKKTYDIRFVILTDELFGFHKSRLKEFCERMATYELPWCGSFRVTDINEESISYLKESNCRRVLVGLESADDRILASMRKHITVEEIENALKLLYAAEISFNGYFIFGDLEETIETAKNTLDWWEAHLEYNIALWPIVSYPGSHLYHHACEQGIIKDRIQYLKDGCPAVNVSKMTSDEMSWLMIKLLEKPFQVGYNIKDVTVLEINPKTNRVSLSGYCAKCNHFNRWHDKRLFTNIPFVCEKCAQKHNTPLPIEIQESVAQHIASLVDEYKTIAIWGLTFFSFAFFRNYQLLRENPDILSIDNAAPKQMVNLYGKKVNSPDILGQGDISAVVVFYPNSMQQISEQIEKYYPSVNKVIDVCDLMA